jgi:2-polyprenyl-6-methoxyphenol hydroxylase-like FAD-dependent oxidoreductase
MVYALRCTAYITELEAPMKNRTVLISGASIAGPALAYWLARRGFAPTIVEIAPGLRPGGQAIDIRGVARGLVEQMGIMPAVREAGVHERGMAYVDKNGRHTATMLAHMFGGEGMVAEIEIMRGDLTQILFEATRDSTEYLFDDRIDELGQSDDGVKVTFRSGLTRTFDIVVGADGVHSGVRALAFGPEKDYVRHLGAYTAYFTVPDPGDLDEWFLFYNAPGGRVVGLRPERGGTAKALLSFTSSPLRYDRRDLGRQQQILADAFAGVGWRTPALIEAMWRSPDFYFDTLCQVHVERWWRGRAVLLGDAGYCGSPLSGLGTSMSLVGAYVLAGELARTPDDHEAAFARYQEEMRDYVAECQKLPPGGVKGFAPDTQLMISMRNFSMRMMTVWPVRSMLTKQFQKSDGIALKAYAER